MWCSNIGLGLNNSCKGCNTNSTTEGINEDVLFEISKLRDKNNEQDALIEQINNNISEINNSLIDLNNLIVNYNAILNGLQSDISRVEGECNSKVYVSNISYREGVLTAHYSDGRNSNMNISCDKVEDVDVITTLENITEENGNYVFTFSKGVMYNGYVGIIVNNNDVLQIQYSHTQTSLKISTTNLKLTIGDKVKVIFKDENYDMTFGYSSEIVV